MREWLALQERQGGGVRGGRALVLSGPPGAGKSAATRCLASEAGLAVCEYAPPLPTLWSEHRHARAGEFASKARHWQLVLRRRLTRRADGHV